MGCGRSNVSDSHVTDGNAADMSPPQCENLISSPPGDVMMPNETAVYFNPDYAVLPDGSLSYTLFTKYTKEHINQLIVNTSRIEGAPAENSESVSEVSIPSIDEESVSEIKPAKRNELELSQKSLGGFSALTLIKDMKTVSSKGKIKSSLGGKQKFDDILQMKDEAMKSSAVNSRQISIMTGSSVSSLGVKPIDNVVRGKFKLPPLNSTYRYNAFDGRNRYQELQDMMDKFNMSLSAKELSEAIREDTQDLIDNLVKEVVNL